MNKKWKENKKAAKNSPILFEDEDMGTTSIGEVRAKSATITPHSKRFTDHSTPIGNKAATDSPELDYIESPIIEPLTQHPPSEVGWDYYRQYLKDDGDGTAQFSMNACTPKRSSNLLFSKKRNSNSPLLHKPIKKKLIQDQQRESMEDFLVVLQQIETKAKQKNDNDENTNKTETNADSQLIVDMDVVSDDSDMKLQVSAHTDESPRMAEDKIIKHKNYNALFNESIDDDIMVLCSQEVEAKEFGENRNQNVPKLSTIEEKSSEVSDDKIQEKISKDPAKENIKPLNTNDKAINDVSCENSSKSNKSESLEIPDDSFDDFFVKIDENILCTSEEMLLGDKDTVVKTHNQPIQDITCKSSEHQKKFFQSKSFGHIESKSITKTNSKSYVTTSQNAKVHVQTKIVNEKASYGYLNKDYMKSNDSSVFNSRTQNNETMSETRLFKAKSFSDSNFFQQSNQIQNFDRSQSNLNINSMHNQQKQYVHNFNKNSEGYGSASSSENKGWRRTNSSCSIGHSQMPSVNRLTNSEGSQSTPEEIERKRQEAIMRRQKKMINNKNNNLALRRPE